MVMTKEWFTVEEAAEYLQVSRRTIYKLTEDGRLPAFRIGKERHRRFRKADLDNVPLEIEGTKQEKALLALTAKDDPVLAEIWDNEKDAAYDRSLGTGIEEAKGLTADRIMGLLKEHDSDLKKYQVKRIGLFGSYVRGEQKKRSDIDVLVDFDMNAFGDNFKGYSDNEMELAAYLKTLFGRKVDLLTEESVSPYIQPFIKKEVQWYEGR